VIGFSFHRLLALLRKEWIEVRRDAMTLRILIAIPIMQLFLFGYAINTDPKNLPTGLLTSYHSKYERTIVAAMKNSGYYDVRPLASEAEAEAGLAGGDFLFVIDIPPGFDRAIDRGESPSILIDADATDPSAIGNATAALASLSAVLQRDLPPSQQNQNQAPAFQFVVHARYNPEQLTVLKYCPGPHLHYPDFFDAVRDDAIDHQRARARHNGKSVGHAGAAA
jgi:ABC-2 type transport system permease protein